MRKSEPDSKYFGKSLENEVFLAIIHKNHPKLCKLFTVWFPKELLHLRHRQNHWFLGELPSWREDFVKLWTSNDLGFLAEVRS